MSLVTFPMLSEARVGAKGDTPEDPNLMQELAEAIEAARRDLAGDFSRPAPFQKDTVT